MNINNLKCKLVITDEDDNPVAEREIPATEILFEHPDGAEDCLTLTEFLALEADDRMVRVQNIRRTCLALNENFPEEHLDKITANSLIYLNFKWAADSWLYDLPFVRLSNKVEPGSLMLVTDSASVTLLLGTLPPQGGCH